MRKHKHSKLIDELGGTSEVARQLDVTESCVSHWRRRGISRAHLKLIKLMFPEHFRVRS